MECPRILGVSRPGLKRDTVASQSCEVVFIQPSDCGFSRSQSNGFVFGVRGISTLPVVIASLDVASTYQKNVSPMRNSIL